MKLRTGGVVGLCGGDAAVYISGVNDKYYTGRFRWNHYADCRRWATVDLSKTVYYYTGNKITINVSVKLNGITLQQGRTIRLSTTASMKMVVDIGKHSITI